jgi:putative SOS response-associated peptidase YedK
VPGRVFLTQSLRDVARGFNASRGGVADPGPRSDIAPGDTVAAVISDPARRLEAMRWGLIPMGRVDARGRPVIETIVNARSETVFAKSAFEGVRRCILPVGGWYEWTGDRRQKTRWRIFAPDEPLLAFAAIWDAWTAPGGRVVPSLATLTCPPNAEVAPVHDRMPVLLRPRDWGVWLGEAAGDPAALLRTPEDGRLAVEVAGPA